RAPPTDAADEPEHRPHRGTGPLPGGAGGMRPRFGVPDPGDHLRSAADRRAPTIGDSAGQPPAVAAGGPDRAAHLTAYRGRYGVPRYPPVHARGPAAADRLEGHRPALPDRSRR